VIRALTLMRLKTLATGHTGVRPVVAETMAAMLNAGITRPCASTVRWAASGDLAPLSHVALVLMGEGEVVTADGLGVEGRGTGAGPRRHHAAGAGPEGGSGADQRQPTACSAC